MTWTYSEGAFTWADMIVGPLFSNYDVMIPACIFFFIVQHLSPLFMQTFFPKVWKKLDTKVKQQEYATRIVAIVHGFLCINTAVIWLTHKKLESVYEVIPGLRVWNSVTTAYFVWDLVVCLTENWGKLYIVHAVISFSGTYLLQAPFCQQWTAFYCGMFEISPIIIHSATLIRSSEGNLKVAKALEYLFAAYFFVVRVCLGWYQAITWGITIYTLYTGTHGEPQRYATGLSVYLAVIHYSLMLLQTKWMGDIILLAVGKGSPPASPTTLPDKKDAKFSSTDSLTNSKPKRG